MAESFVATPGFGAGRRRWAADPGFGWNLAAVLAGSAMAAVALFVPSIKVGETSAPAIWQSASESGNAIPVLAVAMIPAVIAALPLAARSIASARRYRFIGTCLLAVAVAVAAATVGLIYVPVLVFMVLALAATPSP